MVCVAAFTSVLLLLLATSAAKELSLMLIYSGGGLYDSSGVEPAVDLAVELVNENEVIPGYNLSIANRGNPFCERNLALNAFLKNISVGDEKIAVIGCGCSVSTEAVAEVSSFWNITQLSYASTADSLGNRDIFRNLWRLSPSELSIPSSLLTLLDEYDWNVVKIITQEEAIFTETTTKLKEVLQQSNISVNTDGINSFSSSSNISNIPGFYQPEIRVYILNMYSNHARKLICTAALNQSDEYYVQGYVWITLGSYQNQWWTSAVSQDDACDDSLIEPLLVQTIALQHANFALDEENSTDVNLTASKFREVYTDRLDNRYSFEPASTFAYDAVWALAFAIQRSLPVLDSLGISLEQFSYANGRNVTDIIEMQLNNSFDGVSGLVEFDESGTRIETDVQLFRYQRKESSVEKVLVAIVTENGFFYANNESEETIWPDFVPVDGTPTMLVVPLLLPIALTYYVIATIGIIFALVCLFFNIIFRKTKIVRLISPNLNYLIIAGAIMLYASVYFFVLSSPDPFLVTFSCHFRVWLQTMGYYCCFGTILVKIWRVYYIFHDPSIKRKKSRIPKDWHLFLMVMAMCLVMVIVLSCVGILGNYRATPVDDSERSSARNDTTNVVILYQNLVCDGPNDIGWIFFSYACIVISQCVAVVLAFRTRKVTIKALNDSKYLTIIIYSSSIILTIMIVCAVLLDRYLNADGAVFGFLIMVFTTIVLGLTFIPKMVILYKDPKGEKIFDRGQSQATLNITTPSDDKIELSDLQKHCLDLETRLGKYESVTPFRSLTRSNSIRKYSTSILATTTPVHSVNPLSVTNKSSTEAGEKKL